MKLKSCLNTRNRGPTVAWHFLKKKFPQGRTNKGDQNTTGEGSPATSSSSSGLFSILRCLTRSFLSCVLSPLRGKPRRRGRRMQHEDGSLCPTAWHLGGSFEPLRVQTHRQTTVHLPKSRGQTQRQRHTFTTSCFAFSLSGGVSRPEGSLWSGRFCSSCLRLSTSSLSAFSLTSLTVFPRFPFSFCINIFFFLFL